MGLRPTHRDESALLRLIDSKRVTRDFRRSAVQRGLLQHGMSADHFSRIDAAIFPNANPDFHIPRDSGLPGQRWVDRQIQLC